MSFQLLLGYCLALLGPTIVRLVEGSTVTTGPQDHNMLSCCSLNFLNKPNEPYSLFLAFSPERASHGVGAVFSNHVRTFLPAPVPLWFCKPLRKKKYSNERHCKEVHFFLTL